MKRKYQENNISGLIDECAFAAQLLRYQDQPEVSYLYSDRSKSEVDFYFSDCAFELKSKGNPTPKQRELMQASKHSFTVKQSVLPIVAYVVGDRSRFA